jgi:hypothetical protein
MRVKALTRLTVAVLTGLLAGLGLVVGLAVPAQAHYNAVRAEVVCGDKPDTWVITWSVVNSELDQSETITESNRPDVVGVDTVIEAGETLVANEVVTEPEAVTLEVTAVWEDGVTRTNKRYVSDKLFDLTCGDSDKPITYCHQGELETSSLLEFYEGGHLDTTEPQHKDDVYPAGSVTVDGEEIVWKDYGDQGLLKTECKTPEDCPDADSSSSGPVNEKCILTTPSIEVVDECGTDDDAVTLSTGEFYTGVDNEDGTATFTAEPGYFFETDDGLVTELTLTYDEPSAEPCPVAVTKVETSPPTCDSGGELVIPEQPEGVTVKPEPGTYGPGTYNVQFTAQDGYELVKDLSKKYEIDKILSEKKCSPDTPDVPDTGNPPATPGTPDLPDTGASSGLIAASIAALLAIMAGVAMVLRGGRRLT